MAGPNDVPAPGLAAHREKVERARARGIAELAERIVERDRASERSPLAHPPNIDEHAPDSGGDYDTT